MGSIEGDGIYYYVTARCNSGEHPLKAGEDCVRVLEFLKSYAVRHNCHVYHYIVMPSHIHLMLATGAGVHLDVFMHDFCLAVSKDYNKRHRRSGHFWKGRYRKRVVKDDSFALACLRYISLNPVTAGLVQSAKDWVWSGYSFYAYGSPNEILSPHPSYLMLGTSNRERQRVFQAIVASNGSNGREEKMVFGGTCHEGSRRYNAAYRKVLSLITPFIQVELISKHLE